MSLCLRLCLAKIQDLRERLGIAEARLEDNPGAKASRWADLTQPLVRELGGALSKIQETFRVVKWRCYLTSDLTKLCGLFCHAFCPFTLSRP